MAGKDEPTLRRPHQRELIALSLVSVATVLFMWAVAEGVSRAVWPEEATDQCMTPDRRLGVHARPMCVSLMKAAEGPWVEDNWNECSARSAGGCATPPAGTVRIVTIGSSTSWGEFVPLQEAWISRAAEALRARCGHPIDVQSFGGVPTLYQNAARIPDVVALRPDAVVMLVTPLDVFKMPSGDFAPDVVQHPRPKSAATASMSFASIHEIISTSRSLLLAQHYMFSINSDRYVSGYLTSADKADYLRPPFSAAWQGRLRFLDGGLAYMADKLKAAATPFLLVLAPQLAQASLIARRSSPQGISPYALGDAIAEIAARHGILFVDASHSFTEVAEAEQMYYVINGHLNGAGHAVVAAAALPALMQLRGANGEPLCAHATTASLK